MTVTIELKPEIETSAAKQAEKDGLPLSEYLSFVLRDAVVKRDEIEKLSKLTFREIFAPVRRQVKESGISEDELTELLEEAREEAWQERQHQK